MWQTTLNFLRGNEPAPAPRGSFSDYCFLFASAIAFFLFSNLLITGIAFIFDGHLVIAIAWASIALTALFLFFYSRFFLQQRILGFLVIIAAVLAAFLVAILLNRNIYDISYDGQTYQQEAVIQLSNGWNPVYQNLSSSVIGGEEKWINYYPKASWVNESYLYLFTHAERDAKALNIVLIFVAAALMYTALTDMGWLRPFDAIVVSVLLAANPVSLYQSLSFYLDGQLMSLFLSIVSMFFIMYAGKRRFAFIPFFLIIPIFINLKFTAILDAGLLLIIFFIAAWSKGDERLAIKTFLAGAAAMAIGVIFIGASPYITNIVRYKTPFYPLLGAGSIDLKPYNVPGNFIDKSSPEIFFLSFFSQPEGIKGAGTTSTYELPFMYAPGSLVAFRYPDANVGGFGPLFSGALIIAFFILLFCIRRRGFMSAFLAILLVIALSIIDPISSLARYVPQAYLIAIIPIIFLLSLRIRDERSDDRIDPYMHTVAYLAIAFLFFNSFLIGQSYISYNLRISQEINDELAVLRTDSETSPILVYFNEFRSTRVMLQEAGINYTTTDDPNACPSGFRTVLPENTTEFCV